MIAIVFIYPAKNIPNQIYLLYICMLKTIAKQSKPWNVVWAELIT